MKGKLKTESKERDKNKQWMEEEKEGRVTWEESTKRKRGDGEKGIT